MPEKEIRVRIAPSPTGTLHVGTARTALFNELFARKHGGSFIIRTEDTDKERSKPEYEENILDGMKWLGLTWNEGPDKGGDFGPYRQSERTASYTEVLQKLLDEKKAFYCTCPPAKTVEEKVPCTCFENPPADTSKAVIRLKVEPQVVEFHDEIRGDIQVSTESFGHDFVIARAIDDPVFHLAVVVDDALMKISHVIRGEDHLHNTIKHILIQRALGYEQPIYAHLPLLLDEQKRKLSKRSGETSLMAYKEMGYLPEAMLNYLALLGWNQKNDREFFSHDELIEAFSLDGVQKSGAIFSLTKLNSINKYYLKQLSGEELLERARPFLEKEGVTGEDSLLLKALQTEQERVDTLAQLPSAIRFFLPDWQATYAPEMLIWKKSSKERTVELLSLLQQKLSDIQETDFTGEQLQETLMAWIDSENLGRGDTLWPLRVAMTGLEHSPGPFEVASVLGKEESVRRIELALQMLQN